MKIREVIETYSCCYKLSNKHKLSDLEKYGFEPKYNQETGKLENEVFYLDHSDYTEEFKTKYDLGDRDAFISISSRDIDLELGDEFPKYFTLRDYKRTEYNPLRKKVLNFFTKFTNNFIWKQQNIKPKTKEEKEQYIVMKYEYDTLAFDILTTLMEDGIIVKERWNNKPELNYGRKEKHNYLKKKNKSKGEDNE